MKNSRKIPPALARWILRRMILYEDNFLCVGDLDEEFKEIAQHKGYKAARFWYWAQVLLSIPAYLKIGFKWSIIMFKNYLKITLRHTKRQKGYSFINILGLSIGMTCCILIFMYINYELSYDRFHKSAHDIYRVAFEIPNKLDKNASSYGLLAPALMQDFPEVASAARIRRLESTIFYKSIAFTEKDFFLADPELFDVFTFPVISGDPQKALKEPFAMLITQEMVKKYFDDEDPIGKTVLVDGKYEYKITGILKNPPQNSHFHFSFLASFITVDKIWPDYTLSWMNTNRILTYLRLQKDYNPENLERKFPEFLKRYGREDVRFFLQPLTSIHLHSHIKNELEANSDIQYIYIFSVIGLLTLLIACFNYMNLSTARAVYRSREVGVRKVVGAERKQIILQLLCESIFFALAALLISLFLVTLLLPIFNLLINRHLSFDLFSDYKKLCGLFFLTVIVGFFSGSYPAIFLSSFHPIHTLKGTILRRGSSKFRNSLVVIQFGISVVVIIGTLIVYQQLHFIKNRNLGFSKEQIVIVNIKDEKIKDVYQTIKIDLEQNPRILGSSFACNLPNEIDALNTYTWEGQTEENRWLLFYTAAVDNDFIDLLGIELTRGRNFSEEFPADHQACILNESAVKAIGWENPLGKRFGYWAEGPVIGVMKDFHHLSLHSPIGPTVFLHVDKESDLNLEYLLIKINPENIPGTLAFIEKKLKEFSPNYPFNFFFLDERVDKMYRTEYRVGQIFNVFSFTAIFIACLGVFGLISFSTERRTKEIAIRKVLGASVQSILGRLSKEFILLVMLSNCIAWPIAYFLMYKWLQNFAFRIGISFWTFLLAFILSMAISTLAVIYKSLQAATADPTDSLRYE